MEFVEIWNKNSGARISTYVILGERGSRCCILNGAAARTCQPGDPIIVCNSIYLDESQITSLKPRIVTFDQDNHIRDRLSYSVGRDAHGRYSFSILDERMRLWPFLPWSPGRDLFPTHARAFLPGLIGRRSPPWPECA